MFDCQLPLKYCQKHFGHDPVKNISAISCVKCIYSKLVVLHAFYLLCPMIEMAKNGVDGSFGHVHSYIFQELRGNKNIDI